MASPKQQLFKAVISGHESDYIMQLLEKVGIKSRNHTGRSVLHMAVEHGSADLVRQFLEKGCDPNCQTFLGETPLHLAVSTNRADIVELLLKHPDIKVNLPDSFGNNALHLVKSESVREILLQTDINRNARNIYCKRAESSQI
jgi:ankyrin repeat protein